MKKLICFIMALLLSLSLFACTPVEEPEPEVPEFVIPGGSSDGPMVDLGWWD